MIETTIFTTGDLTEVKTWLEENAADIFDNISVNGKELDCYIGETKAVNIGFAFQYLFTLTIDNGVYKTFSAGTQTTLTKAYKTDNGIALFGIGSQYTAAIYITNNGEMYGNDGFTGTTGIRWAACLDAPEFTEIKTPTQFAVTSLSPIPFTNTKVSEYMLNAIWTQLPMPGGHVNPQIVAINGVNYVYDGFACLRE